MGTHSFFGSRYMVSERIFRVNHESTRMNTNELRWGKALPPSPALRRAGSVKPVKGNHGLPGSRIPFLHFRRRYYGFLQEFILRETEW
jgi:hypothetical protein